MKSKPFRALIGLAIFTVVILIGLFCIHRLSKSHLDARQADFYVHQLLKNRSDTAGNEILVIKQMAITIDNQLLSKKYGKWHALLYKPFDIFLFEDYWFVCETTSKSTSDNRFMMIINQYTGEIRIKS